MANEMRRSLTPIKLAEEKTAAPSSSCGQGFRARGIGQANTALHDLDHPVALQLGEGTADRFDGETEVIGDVQPAHGQQRYRGDRADLRLTDCTPSN
jgi:hypothetical protein